MADVLGARLNHDLPESALATPSGAWTPADRISSRGVLPIEFDPELGAIEVYLVNPDGTLQPTPSGLRQSIWDLALRIMTTEEIVAMVDSYKVANEPESERTAWVIEHRTRDGEWILGVNLARSTDPTQVAATLIHEYAHLIALRPGQVVPASDGCETLLLPEGCAAPGSYLAMYHAEFWADYGETATTTWNTDPAKALELYEAHPGAFVSEYAAMNIVEGFAETFSAYVHIDGAIPTTLAQGKLQFFDRFEEMVQIRERIRAELGETLGSVRLG